MLNDILMVMRKYGLQDGEFLDVQLMRSSRLASQLERCISPDGTYPIVGKSLVIDLVFSILYLKLLYLEFYQEILKYLKLGQH